MKRLVRKKFYAITLVLLFILNAFNITAITPTSVSAASASTASTSLPGINYYRGVNLAGPGFSNGTFWTGQEMIDYYANKGFHIFRISISWERIQPVLNGPLDTTYLNNLKAEIDRINIAGKKAIIDLHNYARYNGTVIDSSSSVTTANFTDAWTKLSTEFKSNPAVYGYDLMNEPHDMGTSDWKAISQAAVTAIRNNGDNKVIMVEGLAWSSSYQWEANNNSPTGWISDPANNFLYSAHIYFDYDRTGTYKRTYDEELALNPELEMVGVNRAMDFLNWCSKNNVRGYFGEFGVPKDDIRWNKVLDNFMSVLDRYGMDATYWAGGEGWSSTYNLNCNSVNGVDAPMMSVLVNHLSGTIDAIPAPPEGINEAEKLIVNSSNSTHTITSLYTASGGKYDLFNGNKANDYIEYKVNIPRAGTYHINIKVIQSVYNGKYQLTIDGVNQGYEFDPYFFTVDDDKVFDLEYVTFTSAGEKLFRFTCTGMNATAAGYKLPLDYIQVAPFVGQIPAPVPTPAPDTVAPGAPTGLIPIPVTISQVDLSWTASTDNIGVIGYIIYRDGIEIGRSMSTQFSDKNALPLAVNSYTVRAYDTRNLSDPSTEASAETVNTAPVFLPISDFGKVQYTASKSNLGGSVTSKAAIDENTGKITLSMDISQAWSATEQHPLFYYQPLYDGGEVVAQLTDADMANYSGVMIAEKVTDTAPRFLMSGFTTDAYSADWGTFKVQAITRDTEGAAPLKNRFDTSADTSFKKINTPLWIRLIRNGSNISSYIKNADGSWGNGKGAATALKTVAFTGLAANLPVYAGVAMTADSGKKSTKGNKWSVEFENFSLPNYPLPVMEGESVSFPVKAADRDQQQLTIRITENQLPAGAAYSFENGIFTWSNTVRGTYKVTFSANDGYTEANPMSIVFKVKEPDTQPPSVPSGLTAVPYSYDQISLKWTPSTDNEAVSGYIVYRNGTEVGRTAANEYRDTGLQFLTAYSYTVKACDKAGNISPASGAVSATTEKMPLNFIPVIDFSQIQYKTSSLSGVVTSQGSQDMQSGRITLTVDISKAKVIHEQHPFFYYVPLYGDGEVVTRMTDADMANYAGIMVTEDVSGNLPRLLMTGLTTEAYSPDWGLFKVQSFAKIDANSASKNRYESSQDTALKFKAPPFWVKIVRTGNSVSSYIKNSDESWGNGKGQSTPLRTVTFTDLAANATLYAGVGMSALYGKGRDIWSSKFDNFSISSYTYPAASNNPITFPVRVASPAQSVSITTAENELPAGAIYSLINGQFTWENPIAGSYKVVFAANDGYSEEKMTIILKVTDGTPPETTDNTDGKWHNTDQTVTLSSTDTGSGAAKTMYKLNSGEWTEGSTILVEKEGINSIQYYSIDTAGNTETVKSAEVKIDKTSPLINLSVAETVYKTESIYCPVYISDALSGIALTSVKLDGEEINSAAVTKEALILADGVHTIDVSATDYAGNVTTKSYKFEVVMDIYHLGKALQIGNDRGFINNMGIYNSLMSKINKLQDKDMDSKQITNALNSLENEIKAQSGKQIRKEFSDIMLNEINFLKNLYK